MMATGVSHDARFSAPELLHDGSASDAVVGVRYVAHDALVVTTRGAVIVYDPQRRAETSTESHAPGTAAKSKRPAGKCASYHAARHVCAWRPAQACRGRGCARKDGDEAQNWPD